MKGESRIDPRNGGIGPGQQRDAESVEHAELGWLVRAGLTPAEALRTATSNPVRFLSRTDDFGSVARGRLADLVLLDADPLRDIANTRTVRAVVLDGQLFDQAAMRRLLDDVAERARRGTR
jgi:imidazolonepropionase-like amidohydrolase